MLLSLSAFAMLAAVQADPVSAPSAELPDIVVTGQRMKRIRIVTRRDRRTGIQRCIVKRSSGDPGLDAAFCDAVLACATIERTKSALEECVAPRVAALASQPARPR